jgi:hypothetical protein
VSRRKFIGGAAELTCSSRCACFRLRAPVNSAPISSNMAESDKNWSYFPGHSCRHCNTFVVHLPENLVQCHLIDQAAKIRPNGSQIRLAARLFGHELDIHEREEFYRTSNSVPFFDVSLEQLEVSADAQCLLARRFLHLLAACGRTPDRYALGSEVTRNIIWSLGSLTLIQ